MVTAHILSSKRKERIAKAKKQAMEAMENGLEESRAVLELMDDIERLEARLRAKKEELRRHEGQGRSFAREFTSRSRRLVRLIRLSAGLPREMLGIQGEPIAKLAEDGAHAVAIWERTGQEMRDAVEIARYTDPAV